MAFYPYYKELQDTSLNMPGGNFGLWYNKFIPLSDAFKASDENGKDTLPVEYYFKRYGKMKNNATVMLKRKHADMDSFCAAFPPDKYEEIVICLTLTTPLITGIGESHPHEVSMIFDHNMGIPYIPASGVKGIVRFAHTLSIAFDEHGQVRREFVEDDWLREEHTDIPDIFGGEKIGKDKKKDMHRGKVIFLDAYSEKVPDLHVDIMNHHYGDYYSDDKGIIPPADYLSPNPIKFLTVAAGTVFAFRAVAEKKDDLPQKVRNAFIRALTQEGVGAKTAIGYGRFEITNIKDDDLIKPPVDSSLQKGITVNRQTWESAYLNWSPGNQILTANFENKKATIIGKGLVPEVLHKNLFERRKSLIVRVEVEAVGNSFKIIKIESIDVKV